MKRLTLSLGLLAGVALAACQNDMGADMAEQPAAPPDPAPSMPAAEPATQAPEPAPPPMDTVTYSLVNETTWVNLFAGHDLSQFDEVGGAEWTIGDDGIVSSTGPEAGFLVTRGSYGDVQVSAEFWSSEDGNSGIFMRCQDVANITAETCYEVNIYDQRPDPAYRTGGIVNVAEPMAQLDAAGQWNTYDIIMEGDQITVTMNGTVTVDTNDDEFTHGPIAFQWNGGDIRFRNIRLRPL